MQLPRLLVIDYHYIQYCITTGRSLKYNQNNDYFFILYTYRKCNILLNGKTGLPLVVHGNQPTIWVKSLYGMYILIFKCQCFSVQSCIDLNINYTGVGTQKVLLEILFVIIHKIYFCFICYFVGISMHVLQIPVKSGLPVPQRYLLMLFWAV